MHTYVDTHTCSYACSYKYMYTALIQAYANVHTCTVYSHMLVHVLLHMHICASFHAHTNTWHGILFTFSTEHTLSSWHWVHTLLVLPLPSSPVSLLPDTPGLGEWGVISTEGRCHAAFLEPALTSQRSMGSLHQAFPQELLLLFTFSLENKSMSWPLPSILDIVTQNSRHSIRSRILCSAAVY